MTASRKPPYTQRNQVEDMLALLSSAQERQKMIMIHALQETDFGFIYNEAARQAGEIARVRRMLSRCWYEIQSVIDGE